LQRKWHKDKTEQRKPGRFLACPVSEERTMFANYKEYGFEITARRLPEACTACPFWLVDMKTAETGMCEITGHEIEINGPQDERRMKDCPIVKKKFRH